MVTYIALSSVRMQQLLPHCSVVDSIEEKQVELEDYYRWLHVALVDVV